jgi:hypothetical protein
MEMLQTSGRIGSISEPIGRRATIFTAVLVFHVCIIVLLVLSRQSVRPKQNHGSLSVFSLAASPVAPAIQIPDPIIPVEAIAIISSPAEMHAEQQSAQGDPDGEVCSPLDVVTSQLASDPVVPLAIDRVLPSDRSVSEAIVMWNAEWSAASATDEAPLAEVRSRVLTILASLPPECLTTPVIGPRLIAIPENGYTTFLAFGSGEWSWQQLVEPADEIPASRENSWTWEQLLAENSPQDIF